MLLCNEYFCNKHLTRISLSADEVNNLLQLYEMSINASLTLSKSDKELLNSWTEQHQVQQVNVTTKYRLQMNRHKDHSFRRADIDKKWTQCVDIYLEDIKRSEHKYYEDESKCLQTANGQDKEKRKAVDQVEKEIRKWRKSFRYLTRLCSVDHPDNEEDAKTCLVEYMEEDNYNSTLQRLMLLKLDAMGQLYIELTSTIEHLEECLKTNLSGYLERTRSVLDSMYRCYNGRRKEDSSNVPL
ncbi:hypothetical protein ABMA27_001202 [Loxostege sticticalis]|uniref:Uncharacterized protein n=1 Tax=Loxostege sticticalis TaxID=481309 RepID=A0ABR3HXM6_LOXSC